MNLSFPKMAARNVSRNRRRSAITFAAIVFGVTAVLILNGIIRGFQSVMVDNVVLGNTGALQIHKKGYLDNLDAAPLKLNMPYDAATLAKIRAVPGVKGVTGRILLSGLVTNGRTQTMFVGRGLDPDTEAEACPRAGFDVATGRTLAKGDYANAQVGSELADSFATEQGGAPELLTLSTSSPTGRANSMDVKVAGTYKSALPFENKRTLTVPLKLAQDLVGLDGRVTEYAVAVDSMADLGQVRQALQTSLGDEFEVHDWQAVRPFYKDLMVRQNFVFGLVSLILFVIVITGVINTMLMAVFERVREIGTMMAVGVRRAKVLRLFLWEAAVLGIAGGLGGAVIANILIRVLAAKGIPMPQMFSPTPTLLRPSLEPRYVAVVVAVAIVGAVASAAYPAWKASKLNPVDALRAN